MLVAAVMDMPKAATSQAHRLEKGRRRDPIASGGGANDHADSAVAALSELWQAH